MKKDVNREESTPFFEVHVINCISNCAFCHITPLINSLKPADLQVWGVLYVQSIVCTMHFVLCPFLLRHFECCSIVELKNPPFWANYLLSCNFMD